jgi:hypothetical protein
MEVGPLDVLMAQNIRHLFAGTAEQEPESEPPEPESLPPVPTVEPITRDDLDDYVAGLRQLTKRKRELGPAIEDVQANLDDVSQRIDNAAKYVDDMTTLFDAFPRELWTAEIDRLQDRLVKATKLEIDKYLVTARHAQDELLDLRASLTTSLVAMNEAGAIAGSSPAPKNACPVCLTNAIELVCDPCGHTFCAKCSRDNSTFRMACPMCRAHVNKRIKVYFSL